MYVSETVDDEDDGNDGDDDDDDNDDILSLAIGWDSEQSRKKPTIYTYQQNTNKIPLPTNANKYPCQQNTLTN